MAEELITIRTLEGMSKLRDYLKDKQFIAFDTETTGVTKDDTIIGFSVCADTEKAYYVILAYWDVAIQKLVHLETKEDTPKFLSSLIGKDLIMQNAVFDCFMTHNNFGVQLIDSVHTDTLLLGHLLNENRYNGLKERGVELYGEDAKKEQDEMKASVTNNGGVLTKKVYELYKADVDLIAKYGAKDAILTLKIFYNDVPILFEENLDKFFYEDETMPLLRGSTYQLNTTGLRVDPNKLETLKRTLEADLLEAREFIYNEIDQHVKEDYPGTSKKKIFNIGSSKQLSWLLFIKLGNEFLNLTKEGKEVAKYLGFDRLPYTRGAKREFLRACREAFGQVYKKEGFNKKTGKKTRPKKVGEPWNYLACGKESLGKYSTKYKWANRFLEYAKNKKLLTTYVVGIQSRMKYNVIHPSFLQHGTTSGRYSSRNPNFQNLPRDDKRVKACIVARPGKVFVGADYSQLEPRVFASHSKDTRLINCFKNGDDFYSVVGVEVFEKYGCSLKKNDKNSFAKLHDDLRQISKADVALASTYGTTAYKLARKLNKPVEECQNIIDSYFRKFPMVKKMMLNAHNQVKTKGIVYNLFGRPRRIPKAMLIEKIYGKKPHSELPYEIRNLLNLSVNHEIQSTGSSIINRATIAFYKRCKALEPQNKAWKEVRIVMQVHDELIIETLESIKTQVADLLKECMEKSVTLPGVDLVAEPKIAYNVADLK